MKQWDSSTGIYELIKNYFINFGEYWDREREKESERERMGKIIYNQSFKNNLKIIFI